MLQKRLEKICEENRIRYQKKRKLLNYYPKKSVRNRQTNKEDVTQVVKFKKSKKKIFDFK
jgi:hypothetical protein